MLTSFILVASLGGLAALSLTFLGALGISNAETTGKKICFGGGLLVLGAVSWAGTNWWLHEIQSPPVGTAKFYLLEEQIEPGTVYSTINQATQSAKEGDGYYTIVRTEPDGEIFSVISKAPLPKNGVVTKNGVIAIVVIEKR